MHKKFIQQINSGDEDIPTVMLALRSDPGLATGDDGCEQELTETCYIECAIADEINTGDIVYNIGLTPFDGDNKYYNLVLDIWTPPDGSKVCVIDASGVITGVFALCVI